MHWCAVAGAAYGVTGVGLGAFGAHGLRDAVAPHLHSAWETAVLYQLLHAVVLIALFVPGNVLSRTQLSTLGWLMALGVALFSGSIYALVLGAPSWVGPITPLGGTLLIGGWLVLFVSVLNAARRL